MKEITERARQNDTDARKGSSACGFTARLEIFHSSVRSVTLRWSGDYGAGFL
ncbi:hypothetical protein [Streptomyces sp. NPDC019937]|uniref:hypothetical protein n=1 Tax=Streptomyces sp. NPDC019937 TaxID=3154787 RepID=UPI0033E3085F